MKFTAFFCDRFKPDIVELGNVDKGKVFETFNTISWKGYLIKMGGVIAKEIYYSPSFAVKNKDSNNERCISAVDDSTWYIFYKRPEPGNGFLGFDAFAANDYLTELHTSSEQEVRNCLAAFIENDLDYLEDKMGEV